MVSKAVGDAKLESESKADKLEGKVQNAIGGLKDTLKGKQAPGLRVSHRDRASPSAPMPPRRPVYRPRLENTVVAGAIAAAALTLVLLAFGAGMGFSAVSPWGNSGVSATTFQIGTGVYLIVVAMLASTIGGYVAGRLRTKWVGVHTRGLFSRHRSRLSGLGIGHGPQRCILGRRGQQHCWRRIIRACIGTCRVRWSGGLLC